MYIIQEFYKDNWCNCEGIGVEEDGETWYPENLKSYNKALKYIEIFKRQCSNTKFRIVKIGVVEIYE